MPRTGSDYFQKAGCSLGGLVVRLRRVAVLFLVQVVLGNHALVRVHVRLARCREARQRVRRRVVVGSAAALLPC